MEGGEQNAEKVEGDDDRFDGKRVREDAGVRVDRVRSAEASRRLHSKDGTGKEEKSTHSSGPNSLGTSLSSKRTSSMP